VQEERGNKIIILQIYESQVSYSSKRRFKNTLDALAFRDHRWSQNGGEATLVTKHCRPLAMIVPIEAARGIHQSDRPSFASLLMAIPHDLETERDERGPREVDP